MRGVWSGTGPLVRGRPPVLVTSSGRRSTTRGSSRTSRGSTTRGPPSRSTRAATSRRTRRCAGRCRCPTTSAGACSRPSTAASSTRDGHNGSSIGGKQYEPLKDGLATLIAYRDGRVDVKTWTGGPVAGPKIAFARQSLPLIVDHGRLNPALNDSSQWGYTLGNAVRVWRTGAGIDRHGNLIYAAADYQTVTTLAKILQRAGAVRAMQLDINPEWPTLIIYTHHRGLDPVKVVPNYQQPATRYLVPDDRDFFAVYRRVPGPVIVPFK